MNRRAFLTTVSGGTVVGLSGCSAVDELSSSLDEPYTVGNTQTYEGVEFTPTKYVLAESMTRNYEMHSEEVEASSGATYIFTHLSVVHNGDSEQTFPQVGSTTDVRLVYSDERVHSGMEDEMAQSYVVEGKKLKNYGTVLFDEDATSGVYPGTEVEGWLVHELASNFDPAELELRVIWNNQAFTSGEDEVTHTWTYTEDAEVSIDDVEGEPTTIEM